MRTRVKRRAPFGLSPKSFESTRRLRSCAGRAASRIRSIEYSPSPGYNVELYAELFDVPPFDEDDSDFDPWKSISEPIIAWMRATPPR